MRKQIKNFEAFLLNESKSSSYDDMYKLIVEYIEETLKSKKKINQHVPNSHIAENFKDVLIFLELENKYPNEFHNQHDFKGEETTEKGTVQVITTEKSNFFFLKELEMGDYFNKELLTTDKEKEIHRVYQKMRERDDRVTNLMRLARIKLQDYIGKHLVKRDLKSHKIKNKVI